MFQKLILGNETAATAASMWLPLPTSQQNGM